MKRSRTQVLAKTYALPDLRFEDQALTSFAGLVLFQRLAQRLDLFDRLRTCFGHLKVRPIFGHARVVLILVTHLLLGYRRLRDTRYYRDDPLVLRLLGLRVMPDVATLSRTLASADAASVEKLRRLVRELALDRLRGLGVKRVTLDFDGSVQSTGRAAEGTAVGYNKRKKGARSYYPLFCTIAQTGQVFDFLHRSGNVHDSNGAQLFIAQCLAEVAAALPGVRLETRMDAAFFSDDLLALLSVAGVEFTISAPFERFVELKSLIEKRRHWKPVDDDWSCFEKVWKAKRWSSRYRFVFVRQCVRRQNKQPIQLDLFVPHEVGYDFRVIVTNKTGKARKVVRFHHGRGSQEGIFAELKSQCQMDNVPVRTLVGNQIYLASTVLAHNLNRELQMATQVPHRWRDDKRAPLWTFEGLETIRRRLIQRAGRLTRPGGQLTLTLNGNEALRCELLDRLEALDQAA